MSPKSTATRVLTLLLLATGGWCLPAGCSSEPRTRPVGNAPDGNRVTYGGLQALVMDESDAAMSMLAEAYDEAAASTTNSMAHERLARAKISMAGGYLIHATAANPQVGLIDMVVQVSLERAVINRIAAEATGVDLAPLAASYERTYTRTWALASKVLDQRQLTELHHLIDAWLAENPNETYVSMIRFSDFSELRQQGSLANLDLGTVLAHLTPLSSLDSAAQQVELTRMSWDRTIFLLQRMPQFLRWQANALTFQLLNTPELKSAVGAVAGVSEAADRMSRSVESLPRELESQQKATRELISDARAMVAEINSAAEKLSETGKQYESTASRTREAAEEFTRGAEVVDRVFARLSTPTSQPTQTEVDKYDQAFQQLGAAARLINESSKNIRDAVTDPNAKKTVTDVGQIAEARIDQATEQSRGLIDHLAWRLTQVAAAVCVMVLLTVFIIRWTRKASLQTT